MFFDLYDWAGQVRGVDISKKGTLFCEHDKIEDQGNRIFKRLRKEAFFKDLTKSEFVSELVNLYITTNHLHPFREGNGRTQRLFIAQLTRNAGYSLNFADVDVDELMIATIQSAGGVEEGLLKIFTQAII